jgi:DNA-binding NtrC family response regulator
MDRPHVLAVEDHPGVLELMATVLAGAYEVTTAAGCAAALALVGARHFDVVLTDILMPDGTGFDVLRAVRRRSAATEVVMMTAYANVPDAVAAIKLGAYDYVAKPVDADEIALVVARAVEHLREVAEPLAQGAPRATASVRPDDAERELGLGFRRAVEHARERASREYLVHLLRHFQGNVTHAARRAGMTRESLYRVMRRYGVRAEHEGDAGDARRAGEEPPSRTG